jgi:hypothetical protein
MRKWMNPRRTRRRKRKLKSKLLEIRLLLLSHLVSLLARPSKVLLRFPNSLNLLNRGKPSTKRCLPAKSQSSTK